MTEIRHGSLYVVEQARPKDEVQKELKAIDERLFLERQLCFDQQSVWCVVVDVGLGQPPITILEHRDDDGNAIPELGFRLVDRVKGMERDGQQLAAKVIKQNRARLDKARHDARQEWATIGDEFQKKMGPGHSAVLPRSQSLRMSRDKRRAQGEKV